MTLSSFRPRPAQSLSELVSVEGTAHQTQVFDVLSQPGGLTSMRCKVPWALRRGTRRPLRRSQGNGGRIHEFPVFIAFLAVIRFVIPPCDGCDDVTIKLYTTPLSKSSSQPSPSSRRKADPSQHNPATVASVGVVVTDTVFIQELAGSDIEFLGEGICSHIYT